LFFLLRTLFGESVVSFFSNVIYISYLVFLTLANGFYGFTFWCTNKYYIKANWQVSFLSPLLF
jgi:hypothetical protein